MISFNAFMDKRTILFILLVGATFFGLNIYFGYQRDQKQRDLLQKKEALSEKQAAERKVEAAKRTATASQLPLVLLSKDPEGQEVVAHGINVKGNTLTLGWAEPLPETIYVNGRAQVLQTPHGIKQGPVVYAPAGFKTLSIAAVPEIGTYDIQVVIFPPGETPRVHLGEYREGTLDILLGPLKENGIGLYKTEEGYLPLGFYEGQGRVFIELQNLPLLSPVVEPKVVTPPVIGDQEQRFYVLENGYQQLVFSNVGGALVEINLPFESDKNPDSVVKEIGFDRDIAENSSANAHFPGRAYYLSGSDTLNPPGPIGGYYPLLRRGIKTPKKSSAIPPQFYALAIVSEYPEMAKLVFDVKEFTQEKIVFEALQPLRKITKTYTLASGEGTAPYILDLTIQVEGDSRGLWLTSGLPEVEIMSNTSSPQMQYRMTRRGKSEVEKLDLPKPQEVINVSSVSPDWVVNSNGYLGIIMDPLSEIGAGYRAQAIPGVEVPTRLALIDPKYEPYPPKKYPGYQTLLPLPASGGIMKFRIYAGPFEEHTLKAVDKIYSDPATGYNPDYIACRTFFGWFSFISKPFAKILFVVMSFFYSITGSWAVAIILLTVFLRVLLYPLNAWSIKSMRRMQEVSPQVQAIQKKHKKDPKKGQVEIMNLYREKKVNPFTGCIPILIQIPFLIAMFDLLKSSFQLRGATFIPGWIDNLTAPDVLFQWERPIFFIGNQLHLLPILLGAVMFIQQRLSSTAPKDPSQMTDQQRQQRAMGMVMTVFFTLMFYHFPSGLNLYWLSSMLLGILQQWITNKILDRKQQKAVAKKA